MRYQLLIIFLLCTSLGITGARAGAANITGTWAFSVDYGEPIKQPQTFVFKQEGENLTGSYSGPLGEHKVTGAVKGDKAVFGFEFTSQSKGTGTYKITYTGTIESPTRMTGAVENSFRETRGKWTATKKK